MQKTQAPIDLGKTTDSDDKFTQYTLLHGLKPNTVAYVTQQQPTITEALIQAARMAEFNNAIPH